VSAISLITSLPIIGLIILFMKITGNEGDISSIGFIKMCITVFILLFIGLYYKLIIKNDKNSNGGL